MVTPMLDYLVKLVESKLTESERKLAQSASGKLTEPEYEALQKIIILGWTAAQAYNLLVKGERSHRT